MRAQHHGELADLAGMNKVTAAHRHAPPVPAAAPTPQPQPAATAAKVYPALPPLLDEAVAALVHASPAMLPGLVAQYGSPLHLVWPQRLEDNVRKLAAVLQSHPMPFEIFYGAKVNKSPALVRAAVQAGIGVDVSSLYEAGDALRAVAGLNAGSYGLPSRAKFGDASGSVRRSTRSAWARWRFPHRTIT